MPETFFHHRHRYGRGQDGRFRAALRGLDAIYWKPVQTGTREGTDTETVMQLGAAAAPEDAAGNLSLRASGFASSRRANGRACESSCAKSKCPHSRPGNLIAEGAGGVLVPINRTQLMTDLMRHLNLPVLLVARTSLGTINHTLLSLAALRAARLDIRGGDHGRRAKSRKRSRHRTLRRNSQWSARFPC